MLSIRGKKVVLAVTGSIAAYKAAQICSLLKKKGAHVYPVMSPNAVPFLGPLTLSALAGHKTIVHQYEQGEKIHHISLAHSADVMVIAPATANTISKIACGICDNFLTPTAISASCPVLVAPAMNRSMYAQQAVQDNIQKMKSTGKYYFIGPQIGNLACGQQGMGKMTEPLDIVKEVSLLLDKTSQLAGKKVLISAGGTREFIDSVRYISNLSSGKMGAALAQAASNRGADQVVLVTTESQTSLDPMVEQIVVQSSQQMKQALLKVFSDMDITIMAAAVSDIVPRKRFDYKLKKKNDILSKLDFEMNENILKLLAQQKKEGQLLIGFAAEHGVDTEQVLEKLHAANIDAIVANDISRKDMGMGSDYNAVSIISRKGKRTDFQRAQKTVIAAQIWDFFIENFLQKRKA